MTQEGAKQEMDDSRGGKNIRFYESKGKQQCISDFNLNFCYTLRGGCEVPPPPVILVMQACLVPV